MSDRYVIEVHEDNEAHTSRLKLATVENNVWSEAGEETVKTVISHISRREHVYYTYPLVPGKEAEETRRIGAKIILKSGRGRIASSGGQYLTTIPDGIPENNLDNLPRY